ncbi:MAG: hypothetical protein WDM85_00190 [Caulobacteraceae bacterium]
MLAPSFSPPGDGEDDGETNARQDYAAVDPMRRGSAALGWAQALLDRTLWRSFALFERIAGGARSRRDESPASRRRSPRSPASSG